MKTINFKNILINAAIVALSPFAYAQDNTQSIWDYLKPQTDSSRIIKIDKKDFEEKVLMSKETQTQRREEVRLYIERYNLERDKSIKEYEALNNTLKEKEQKFKETRMQEEELKRKAILAEKQKRIDEELFMREESARIRKLKEVEKDLNRQKHAEEEIETKRKVEEAVAIKKAQIEAERVKKEQENLAKQKAFEEKEAIQKASIENSRTSNEINQLKKQIEDQKKLIDKNNQLLEKLTSKLNDPEIAKEIIKKEQPEKVKIF